MDENNSHGPQAQHDVPSGAMLPVCPHCGEDPARIQQLGVTFPATHPGAVTQGIVFFCGNSQCRKLLPVIPDPRAQAARNSAMESIPGRRVILGGN